MKKTLFLAGWWRIGAAWLLLGLVGVAAEPAPETHEFRAGAAVGDITPELGLPIVGNFETPPATHVHDPLQVRALVLDDGRQRLAFVVCDNVGMPREVIDEAKRLAQRQTGLAPAHVLISSTHTHSGVSAGAVATASYNVGERERAPEAKASGTVPTLTAYQQFVARRIADTLQRAINQLEPARIGWGVGRDGSHVFNRRWFVSDEADRRNPFGGVDAVRMNPPASAALLKPAGPTDPEISFLSVQAKSGRPIALYAVYSLHYVGGVPAGVISADYFALFARRIGELLGADRQDPAFVGLLANGTSGDVNNINFRQRGPRRAPYEQMARVANAVAAEVYRAYQAVEHRDWVPLDARYEELPLHPRRPSAAEVARARAILDGRTDGPPWHPREKAYAGRVLQLAEGPEVVEAPLQVFRIGEVGLLALPGEVFAETGLELKARAPFKRTIPVGLANGYSGYLPTVEQHRFGGYESWMGTNRLEIEAVPKMVAALLRLAAEVPGK